MEFELHPRLAEDCHHLGNFPLCALLLSKDANYPWYILVPREAGISEAFQLSHIDQQKLQHESLQLSHALSKAFTADKMNIAALGNMVPQLHLHHIVRYKKDAAWPNPVWGYVDAKPYDEVSLAERTHKTLQLLHNMSFTPTLPTD